MKNYTREQVLEIMQAVKTECTEYLDDDVAIQAIEEDVDLDAILDAWDEDNDIV